LEKKGLKPAHYDMRFLKPIDEDILHEVGKQFSKIITIEDGTIIGGLGSAVIEFMNDHSYSAKVKRLGIPDEFIEHGTQLELRRECKYDINSIVDTVLNLSST
jgi:1-deoxy-D-xylulose-5-phosphate synthase